jgi:hypothetical protein
MWSLLLVWMLMRWMRRQRRANSDGEIPHQGREGGWGGARRRRSVRRRGGLRGVPRDDQPPPGRRR